MPNHTLNCNGLLIDLVEPKVVAILNVTPDSFYDGGTLSGNQAIKNRIHQFIDEKADIIDIGAMSSRPNSTIISEDEEWSRLEFAIHYILDTHPDIPISIDTIHASTAKKALDLGCHIINDISGGNYDENMLRVVGEYDVPFIGMHMRAIPSTMQFYTDYPKGILLELLDYFKKMINKANQYGIRDVIIDPGFGFAKTLEQNYAVLNELHVLKVLEKPILVGISRKSMICKVLNIKSSEALNGTSVLNMLALKEGAKLLRVHDPKECKEVVRLFEQLNSK